MIRDNEDLMDPVLPVIRDEPPTSGCDSHRRLIKSRLATSGWLHR